MFHKVSNVILPKRLFYLLLIIVGCSIAANVAMFKGAFLNYYTGNPTIMDFNQYGEAPFEAILAFALIIASLVTLVLAFVLVQDCE